MYTHYRNKYIQCLLYARHLLGSYIYCLESPNPPSKVNNQCLPQIGKLRHSVIRLTCPRSQECTTGVKERFISVSLWLQDTYSHCCCLLVSPSPKNHIALSSFPGGLAHYYTMRQFRLKHKKSVVFLIEDVLKINYVMMLRISLFCGYFKDFR